MSIKVDITFHDKKIAELSMETPESPIKISGPKADWVRTFFDGEGHLVPTPDGLKKMTLDDGLDLMVNLFMAITGSYVRASEAYIVSDVEKQEDKEKYASFDEKLDEIEQLVLPELSKQDEEQDQESTNEKE